MPHSGHKTDSRLTVRFCLFYEKESKDSLFSSKIEAVHLVNRLTVKVIPFDGALEARFLGEILKAEIFIGHQEGEAEDTVAVALRANGSKALAKAYDIGAFAKQIRKLRVGQPASSKERAILVLGVIGGKKFADLLIRLVKCLGGKGDAGGNMQIDGGVARHQPLVPLGLW